MYPSLVPRLATFSDAENGAGLGTRLHVPRINYKHVQTVDTRHTFPNFNAIEYKVTHLRTCLDNSHFIHYSYRYAHYQSKATYIRT